MERCGLRPWDPSRSEGIAADWEGTPVRGAEERAEYERNVRRVFKDLLMEAELPPMRIHDLRHTTATLLLAQAVHPRVVMETLGHSQISLTLDTYSHVIPGLQAEAAKRMNDALGSIGSQNGCQDGQPGSEQPVEGVNSLGKVVSRLGIEPRTRRLRVCCSAN